MKQIRIFTTLLALAGAALLPQSAKAQVDYTTGDLLMGFQTTNSLGGSSNTVVVNLGNVTLYRDATSSFTISTIGNLGAVLDATFGGAGAPAGAWFTRSDVYWGVAQATNSNALGDVGISNFKDSTTSGDPESTFYIGKSEQIIGTKATDYTVGNITAQVQVAGAITAFKNRFTTQTAAAGTNNKIAVIPTSVANGWEDYNLHVPPNTSFVNLANGEGNFGNGTAGTALDLFRQLSTISNLDYVPDASVLLEGGEAALRGTYQGTFTITDAGVLTFLTQPIPEPSTTALLAMAGVGLLIAAFRRYRTQSNV